MQTGKIWVPVHKDRGPWWEVAHPSKAISLKRAAAACVKTEKEFLLFDSGRWEMKQAVAIVIESI